MKFSRNKVWLSLVLILMAAIGAGFFDWSSWREFKLGLDLQGGVHLIYQADLSGIPIGQKNEAMQGVRDVIERRVNLLGLTEPVVQTTKNNRLIIELAGAKDPTQAIALIGQTPSLDFRTEKWVEVKPQKSNEQVEKGKIEEEEKKNQQPEKKLEFKRTQLTGRHIKTASMSFDPTTNEPVVTLKFNDQGTELFAQLTKENVGKRLAIFLDGLPISIPVVNEEITAGEAVISGNFNIETARQLAQRLNAGALPVPISLLSQQTIGASLGEDSLDKSLKAGLIGLIAVALFMVIFYRLRGLAAVLALIIYAGLVLAIFKLMPVTLTLAGIAGFILSLGMAIDANVLIFERLKEEEFLEEGFSRAWPAIRDGNISTLLTCLVLYLFTVGLVKGFAITLGIGVLISMFSAIIITRVFLELKT